MSDERKVVPPRKGLLHLVDAAGYSLQGLRRLLRESAAILGDGGRTHAKGEGGAKRNGNANDYTDDAFDATGE